MSEKNLVICDEDLRYANALAENILERDELSVKVFTFSNINKAIIFLQDRTVQILIIDEQFWCEKREEIKAEEVFVVTKGELVEKEAPEKVIYKYQCADNIIRQVFETYVESTKDTVLKTFRKNRTRLEGIYSPVHGIGKTRFAIALGKERAKHEKILYLNLEEYAGFEEAFPDENVTNLGDLLYYIKQNENNLGLKLQSSVKQMDGLFYVPPMYLSVDLRDVKVEEWIYFLERLKNLNLYDAILLDLGESLQGIFNILELCDKIYMPVRDDAVSYQKLKRYEECVERLQLTRLKSITQKFVVPENLEEFIKLQMREDD